MEFNVVKNRKMKICKYLRNDYSKKFYKNFNLGRGAG